MTTNNTETKHTPEKLKVSGYRPVYIIARDPKESTYEVGDDRFEPVCSLEGDWPKQKAIGARIVECWNAHDDMAKEIAQLRADKVELVAALEFALTTPGMIKGREEARNLIAKHKKV